ncbi:MAG: hypothetical protein QNJ38_22690 [Prochloraceae cyanobacterium]|nr:hypothetical protein [Prochloraceae cyanobacterium]
MKRSLFLTGAIALIIFGASISPAMAKEGTRLDRMAENLSLTESQKNRVERVFKSSRTQIENILTAEQKAQLETIKERGMKGRKMFKSLNLSEDQKQQIRAIRQNTRQQVSQILTTEQRQKMQEIRQQRKQNRQR